MSAVLAAVAAAERLGTEVFYDLNCRPSLDGPMLRHGLQDHHGRPLLVVPEARRDRPDPDRLAERYEAFLTA